MRLVFDDPVANVVPSRDQRFCPLGVRVFADFRDLGQTFLGELVDNFARTVTADALFAFLSEILLESVDLLIQTRVGAQPCLFLGRDCTLFALFIFAEVVSYRSADLLQSLLPYARNLFELLWR